MNSKRLIGSINYIIFDYSYNYRQAIQNSQGSQLASGASITALFFFAGIVREDFSSGGLPTLDSRPFQSHLTVAKTSKQHRMAEIPPHSYASHVEQEFGEQVVEGLELLSMNKPPDSKGYYHCFKKCSFDEEQLETFFIVMVAVGLFDEEQLETWKYFFLL